MGSNPFGGVKAVARLSGTIAQLVEQRTENPCVAGSIPAGTTKKTLTMKVNHKDLLWYIQNIRNEVKEELTDEVLAEKLGLTTAQVTARLQAWLAH